MVEKFVSNFKGIKMADQKIDPNRPKDDQDRFATAHYPTAEPPVDEDGKVLPLGEETLEAQREAFKKAQEAQAGGLQDNPLDVAGVEADVQNATQNPEASGPADASKEDVQKQGEATKQGVKAQAEAVKVDQQAAKVDAAPATKTTTEAPKQGPGQAVHLAAPTTAAQPHNEGPAPVKHDKPAHEVAKEEGKKVKEGDPQKQHAEESHGRKPKPVNK